MSFVKNKLCAYCIYRNTAKYGIAKYNNLLAMRSETCQNGLTAMQLIGLQTTVNYQSSDI